MKSKRFLISGFIMFIIIAFTTPVFTQQQNSNWVSAETVASVVAIGKIFNVYVVKNMPDGHEVTVNFGIPNFGGGTVVNKVNYFTNIGSGVLVSADGWIFTNWHVSDDSITVYDKDQYGQFLVDGSGNRVKQVFIPAHPGFVWISTTTPEEAKTGRAFSLRYLAETVVTNNYISPGKYWGYDMAICKIIKYAEKIGNELPSEKGAISPDEKFVCSAIGNPFIIDRINEPGVASIGFPGIGPQEMQSITRGDFMGYESSNESVLNHSCRIAGGNSGGGFYYKDKLVGINTWSTQDRGNTTSKAQPVTFFINPIAYCKLMIGEQKSPAIKNLPEIETDWVKQDPSEKDPYKNQVYLGMELVSAANQNRKLEYSVIFFYKDDIDAKKAEEFIMFNLQYIIWDWSRILYYQYGITDDASITQILLGIQYIQMFGLDPKELLNFVKNVRPLNEDQFRNTYIDYTGYIDIIKSGEFFAELYSADNLGKIMVYAQPDKKYKFTVLYKGFQEQEFEYSTNGNLIQGPFVVKVNPR
ncbi:MAG: trypsin-like peptidase domain-containing protein [Spirochaetales bacterium]|nr:trypsin-like peptidase domain-containing protein [Spirochaetales bacterium]